MNFRFGAADLGLQIWGCTFLLVILAIMQVTVIVKPSNLPKIGVEAIFILELPPIAIDPKFKDCRVVGGDSPRSLHAQQFCNQVGQKSTVGHDPELVPIFVAVENFEDKPTGTIANFHQRLGFRHLNPVRRRFELGTEFRVTAFRFGPGQPLKNAIVKFFEIIHVGDDDRLWVFGDAETIGPVSDKGRRSILKRGESDFGGLQGALEGTAVDVARGPAFSQQELSKFLCLVTPLVGEGIFSLALHSFLNVASGFGMTNEEQLQKLHEDNTANRWNIRNERDS